MTRRVGLLAAGQAMLLTALIALARLDGAGFGHPERLLGLTAAFALVGLFPMHLELRRSACTVTLVEGVLVLALFGLGPLGVVVAAGAGEAIACLTHRQRPLQVAYNSLSTALAAVVAALAFAALAPAAPAGSAAWMAALAAVAAYAVCDHTATALVLAVTGEGRLGDIVAASAALAAAASGVSGSVGLALVVLSERGPAAPLLLAPAMLIVAWETRQAAAHRAEHLRLRRLAAAAGRTTGLQSFSAALGLAATEGRDLITGSVALCCAPGADGVWRGVIVDDGGVRQAEPDTVSATVGLVVRLAPSAAPVAVEVGADDAPAALRSILRGCPTMIVAGAGQPDDDRGQVGLILLVARRVGPDRQGRARAEALAAFVGHAELSVTNAVLYERIEDALRRQLDLNRQKDEFVAAVSHELRTPLASMLGSVETLRRMDERLDAERRQRFLTIAHRQGQRLQRLIEDLLATAAVEHRQALATIEDVDLDALLGELDEDLTTQLAGRLVIRVDPDARRLRTDAHKLRQVLLNLIGNAAKYAPTGPIEILAARGTIGEVERVLIRVVDHGPGIAADDRARVFDRFVQLDGSTTRQQGGTGLGLYLARRMAHLLDATLNLTDTPGGGATFALSLPVALRLEEPPAEPPVLVPATATQPS